MSAHINTHKHKLTLYLTLQKTTVSVIYLQYI